MQHPAAEYISPQKIVSLLKERIARANQLELEDEGVHTGWQFLPKAASLGELASNFTACSTPTWPLQEQTTPAQHTANEKLTFHTSFAPDSNVSEHQRNSLNPTNCYEQSRRNIYGINRHQDEEKDRSAVPLSIIPVTVYNNNNIYTSNWQGNTLTTSSIPQQHSHNTLATGNTFNHYKVGNDFIDPHVCVHHSIIAPVIDSIGSCDSERTLTQLGADKMSSYGNENMTGGGRMRVKPIGDDYFMLTVEDTGISPHQLQQQIRDQAMRYPGAPLSHHQPQHRPSFPTVSNSHSLGTPKEQYQVSGDPGSSVMNTVSGQPFMVTWSENGLPRINMLSTPWLANTLTRQRDKAPAPTVAIPSEPARIDNRNGRSGDTDIPVFKIVANEPVPVHSPVPAFTEYEAPPTPPPRSRTRSNVPTSIEPIHTTVSGFSHTPSVNSRTSDQWGSLGGSHDRGHGVRINAPIPIDVRQVPAARKQQTHSPMVSRKTSADDSSRFLVKNSTSTAPMNVYESVTLPLRKRREPPVNLEPGVSDNKLDNQKNYVTVKHVDRNANELPTYKISPTPAVSRFRETLPRSEREQRPASGKASNDDRKAPGGYLQNYLREVRSPSPARKSADRERGRQRSLRGSTRARSRERRMRSPSPMPDQRRDILFNDEIDWTDNDTSPNKVDWDQITAVLRLVSLIHQSTVPQASASAMQIYCAVQSMIDG